MQFPDRPSPLGATKTAPPAPAVAEDTRFQKRVLGALQTKHVYAGTVSPAEVRRRRAKNKVARKSRRRNR